MPFSVLLLSAASSKRHIAGVGDSRVIMDGELKSGELALFFHIDEDAVRRGLNMSGMKCCDGLIFYARDGEPEKTICLVELKSNDLGDAAQQISQTRKHLAQILRNNCQFSAGSLNSVVWKACIYRHSSTLKQTTDCRNTLRDAGFREDDIVFLRPNSRDIGPFLRGNRDLGKQSRSPKHH